jgi:hypothetical protein
VSETANSTKLLPLLTLRAASFSQRPMAMCSGLGLTGGVNHASIPRPDETRIPAIADLCN